MAAHLQTNFGVIIYIDGNYAENTNIGLFHTSDTLASMILCAAPDVGGNFVSGILMDNGIDPIEKSIDLRYGGNTEEISGTQIVLNNTGDYSAAGDTLSKYFYDEGIKIQGCKCDIFEFTIVDSAYVYNLLFSGICQNPTWKETEYIIPIEPHVNETSVSSVIDKTTYPYAPDDSIGKLVPVVFGSVENARGIITLEQKEPFFVLDATYGIKLPYNNDLFFYYLKYFTNLTNGNVKFSGDESKNLNENYDLTAQFAQYGGFPNSGIDQTWAVVDDGLLRNITVPTSIDVSSKNIFCEIKEGTGEGIFRKVKTLVIYAGYRVHALNSKMGFIFDDFLSKQLTAVAPNTSYIDVYFYKKQYEFSKAVCIGILNELFATTTNAGSDTYAYSENNTVDTSIENKNQILKINDSGYFKFDITTFISDENNKSLFLNKSENISEKNTYNSFIYKVPSLIYLREYENIIWPYEDVRFWSIAIESIYGGMGLTYLDEMTAAPGILIKHENAVTHTIVQTGDVSDINTSDINTFYESVVTVEGPIGGQICNVCNVIDFDLPENIPEDFDDIIIMINSNFSYSAEDNNNEPYILSSLFWREFDGSVKQCNANAIRAVVNGGNYKYNTTFRNTPKINYIPEEADSNKYLFTEAAFYSPTNDDFILPGYNNYIISGITKDNYKKIYGLCFFSSVYMAELRKKTIITTRVTDIKFCFRKSVSSTNIYNNFGGIARAVDETWNSRRTAETIVSGPIEILEKIALDTGDSVDQSNDEGGFYYAGDYLAEVLTDFDGKICRQINDLDASKVSDIRKTICADTFLAHYTTPPTGLFGLTNGRTCVSDIVYPYYETGSPIAGLITIADVIGDISPINENSIENIFCEPKISYKFDYGKDDFSEILSVTNSDKTTYNTAYVIDTSGTITESEKEALWNQSRALYLHYKQFNTPPSELVETFWISNPTAALAKMNRWYKWMGCYTAGASIDVSPRSRIRFSVGYAAWRNLRLCNHINIDFPSHTFGVSREALIEKISIDINSAIVTLECSLYPQQPVQQFAIKDTFNTGVFPSWKDTLTETALNEIKDTFA